MTDTSTPKDRRAELHEKVDLIARTNILNRKDLADFNGGVDAIMAEVYAFVREVIGEDEDPLLRQYGVDTWGRTKVHGYKSSRNKLRAEQRKRAGITNIEVNKEKQSGSHTDNPL